MEIEELLTLSEACKRLGVHPTKKWDRQKVRVVRTVGGRRIRVKLNV
ncbi:MAG: hypothetical protein QXR13_03075 [Candidatus Bathyarchaeia archaeon]